MNLMRGDLIGYKKAKGNRRLGTVSGFVDILRDPANPVKERAVLVNGNRVVFFDEIIGTVK